MSEHAPHSKWHWVVAGAVPWCHNESARHRTECLGRNAIRIVVLYNEPVLAALHRDAESEAAVAAAADFITDQLSRCGATVIQLPAGDLARLEADLDRHRPDVVFNLFEGLADSPYTESSVADLLGRSGLAFTGASARALSLARNKPLAKRWMDRAGLPTPRWRRIDARPIGNCGLCWPVIVKPAHEDASIGIDQGSVVVDRRQLDVRVERVQTRYGCEVLLEEYLPGREFSVAVVEYPKLRALPTIDIEFHPHAGAEWPILTYDSKWRPGSVDYEASRAVYGASLPASLRNQIDYLACRAFRLFGCRDYARIDFRIAADGQPNILEVNPNSDLSPTACFCGALRSAGISPCDLLVHFVQTAKRRLYKCTAHNAIQIPRSRIACT